MAGWSSEEATPGFAIAARIAVYRAGSSRTVKTAAARVMLTQVFYGMRDGYIRRAASQAA